MTIRTLTRRAALAAVAVTGALVLAACGGDNDSADGGHTGHGPSAAASASATPGASAAAHNDQDVSFAQGMIPHHRQALEMARLADGRASSAQVKDLASRIEKAQDPEIRTMTGWLTSWGEQAPMAGMDHSGHSGMSGMSGMMSEADMADLEKATGKDFDTRFLSMMVDHHEGAVEMATTEKERGQYGPAKTMADAIVTAQNAEIKEMRQLLGTH
ncbi:DUF305 domain-containing protein [Streptomyces argyrophyllae]|uniref:DUF305 domain-containing protein n=1 Tax=Streptomyces argyrophylli TaxID=2726118 RepID=A0A6M4PQQ9_9ACTN|nr:DUF305 domain-containing protein [Streptomyces argyrophyllae]QJS13252.1 DUF305 domain-containing protein [Streptomyces argyrophyllae]